MVRSIVGHGDRDCPRHALRARSRSLADEAADDRELAARDSLLRDLGPGLRVDAEEQDATTGGETSDQAFLKRDISRS